MTIPSADAHCSYHAKILAGLITSTRAEGTGGKASIQDVRLTPGERATADEARERRHKAVVGDEERQREIVLTEAWEKALEEEFAKIDGFREP